MNKTAFKLLGILLCLTQNFIAQELDQTLKEIDKMKNDTNKVLFVNDAIWKFKYENPQKCIAPVEANIQLSKKLQFHNGTANAYKLYGVLMDETGRISESVKAYQDAIIYFKKAKDTIGVAKSEANIGILYRDQRRFPEAIEQFNNCLGVFERADFVMGLYMVRLNLSICEIFSGNSKAAMEHIREAEKQMKRMGVEDPNYYGNLANIYMETKNYSQAEINFKKALELDPKGHGAATWIDNLAMTYSAQKKYDKAIPLFLESIDANPNGQVYSANAMSTHWHLANAYIQNKQPEEAYKTLLTYIKIRDSIFSRNNADMLSELSKKYDTEKKMLQIKSLRTQKKIQAEKIASEKRQKFIFAGGMIVFLVLGIFLYRLVVAKKKANKVISEQKLVVEQQKESLEIKNREILDSITYAKRLQDAILPAKDFWRQQLPDSFILYKPKDIVAGDFYWLEKKTVTTDDQQDELLFFAAADCTGHGVPGAMVSVICCTALNRAVLEFHLTDPGNILDTTRKLVVETFRRSTENVKDGMDISLGCINLRTRQLFWAGANNPLWIIPGDSEEIIEWKPDKEPIGAHSIETPFTTHEMVLPPESKLYLFTDGYADQFGGESGKKFKYKQFKESILAIHSQSMLAQQEHLDYLFENWKGNLEQIDDVCVIGIRL